MKAKDNHSHFQVGDLVQVLMPRDLQPMWVGWKDPMIGLIVEIIDMSGDVWHYVHLHIGIHAFRTNAMVLVASANG